MKIRLSPKRNWRTSAAFIVAIAGYNTAIGQTQMKAPPAGSRAASARGQQSAPVSPEGAAALMWGTLLTTCSAPNASGNAPPAAYYLENDSRKPLGILLPRRLGMLFELRKPWTKLFPEELTAADRLNKIQFKGHAVLGFEAYRFITQDPGAQWSSFEVGATTKPNAIKTFDDIGNRDNVTLFEIEQRNGHWIVDDHLDLNSLSSTAVKMSCADLMSATPFAVISK